ncbi:RNA-binding S4 domain-containing protein [Leptothrix ochracea]|uniref:RNA-binding S4 domain-containing protein n=1 Tax=Leptothrix ochracea TaxID=735331 RepID=UPI0034E28F57
MRLDKWLWAARFFKTRSLATEEVGRNRVLVNEQAAKASREVRVGDRLSLRQGDCPIARVVTVLGVSEVRGPAPIAQALYSETPESLKAQADWRANRVFLRDPAQGIEQGRPTKQDRRRLEAWQSGPMSHSDNDNDNDDAD